MKSEEFYSLKWWKLYLIIVLLTISVSWVSKALLINEIVFYNTYSAQLSYDRAMKLFEDMQRNSWLVYMFLPVLLLVKIIVVTLVIFAGSVLLSDRKANISHICKSVTAGEIIIVTASLVKCLWLHFFGGNYDINDLRFFTPLALSNLFTRDEVSAIWVYPLQTLNLFHIGYLLLISFILSKIEGMNINVSGKVVFASYAPALAVWIALVMFLSLG